MIGEQLFLSLGCLACHTWGDLGASGWLGGGDLTHIAAKRPPDFFAAWLADPARLKMFKGNLVDQICEASGGPCKYKGKDMKTAHMGMGVSGGDFTALVEDLSGALDALKVGAHEKDQLLGALAPMKAQIVEKP